MSQDLKRPIRGLLLLTTVGTKYSQIRRVLGVPKGAMNMDRGMGQAYCNNQGDLHPTMRAGQQQC